MLHTLPINLTTDKYKTDAKSIMGVFSMDLSQPVTIEVPSDEGKDFIAQLDQFKPVKQN